MSPSPGDRRLPRGDRVDVWYMRYQMCQVYTVDGVRRGLRR